jgi:phosphatidylglycerol:prolipoprotein diacylglycerol transferase
MRLKSTTKSPRKKENQMSPISPTFNIGPLAIHLYGIIMIIAAIAASFVASMEAKRKGDNPEYVWTMVTWCLIAGILGARLYHVLSSPQGSAIGFRYYFITNPFETIQILGASIPFPTALMIWNGGLGIYGGIVGGVLALAVYTWRNHLSLPQWLDTAAPSFILAQAIGRWGNFVNQELYGPPTTLPWGIPIDAQHRLPAYADLTRFPVETTRFHPVFLYESLWNLAGCAALLYIARRFQDRLKSGDISCLYLVIYGVGRLLVEALRPDAWLVGGIPAAQIVSVVAIVIGVALMVLRRRQTQSVPLTDQ